MDLDTYGSRLYRPFLEAIAYARGVYGLPAKTWESMDLLDGKVAPEIALEQAAHEWNSRSAQFT